jgi:hypothetical protein
MSSTVISNILRIHVTALVWSLLLPSMAPGTVTGDSKATMVTHTALRRRRISWRATSGAPVGPTSLHDSSTTST